MSDIIFKNEIFDFENTFLEYTVKWTGITDTPTAIVLRCLYYSAGRYWECSQEYNGALYFDEQGRIVDLAPLTPATSTRRLQELYAESIREDLSHQYLDDGSNALQWIYPLVSGFFLGEKGIARVQYFPEMSIVHNEI